MQDHSKQKNVDLDPVQISTSMSGSQDLDIEMPNTVTTLGTLMLRGVSGDNPYETQWELANLIIIIVEATIGPLANVLSIVALVTAWKAGLANGGVLPEGSDELGTPIPDQKWQIALSATSLACGFLGNFFLLIGVFGRRVRYIIWLPMSVILWLIATGTLVAGLIATHIYVPPIRPGQTYSQGFWYAVLASILYCIEAIPLMIQLYGYIRGYCPQSSLSNMGGGPLVIKAMLFFFWMAAGAGIFSNLCGFNYADALYLCNGTLLAIGYGNFAPTSDSGRRFVIPYTITGIIVLGLMINDLLEFVNNVKRQLFRIWAKTFLDSDKREAVLKLEEKELFNAMREIPRRARKFSHCNALIVDMLAFFILMFVGALVFMLAERREHDISYSAALYFSYVSLPAIGYGGLVLESNAGKPFFIIWSLFVIPTLAMLISDSISAIIAVSNADWTLLPCRGTWDHFLLRYLSLKAWLEKRTEQTAEERRLSHGIFMPGPALDLDQEDMNIERLPDNDRLSNQMLAHQIAKAIQRCASDLSCNPPKAYSFEEWNEYIRLLRSISISGEEIEKGREEEIVKESWAAGYDSPFLTDKSEAQWVLERLIDGWKRYTDSQLPEGMQRAPTSSSEVGKTIERVVVTEKQNS